MSFTRVACPECGAGLKSPTGFAVGQTVCCPKCESYFAVESQMADSDDAVAPSSKSRVDDEPEWSYRNSWLRFVVLGILLVTLGVVSYLYYEKKIKPSDEASPQSSENEGRPVDVRIDPSTTKNLPQLTPQTPGGVPAQPPGGGKKSGDDGKKSGNGGKKASDDGKKTSDDGKKTSDDGK